MTPEELYKKYQRDIANQGILLNPDRQFTTDLLEGILTNRERYGEDYCPCRLISGVEELDREIICPCIYRDMDIAKFGQCYCALFVNQEWIDRGEERQIPERWLPDDRLEPEEAATSAADKHDHEFQSMTFNGITVWYCTVCGYMAIRTSPPEICPVCKAKKERFDKLRMIALDHLPETFSS